MTAAFGSSISEQDIDLVRSRLQQLEQQQSLPEFQRNLKVVAYINFLFEKAGLQAIVVGGHAIEIYTAGSYHTSDIDLVMKGAEIANRILETLGFVKESIGHRHWYYEPLNLAIEIPDENLLGSEQMVNRVELEDGFSVNIIGIEDLILDRLRAWLYWKSEGDGEWALFLLKAQESRIDFDYLESRAKEEDIELYHRLCQLRAE